MPNCGSGGPSSDCSGALGGDGSMGRYCGGGVTALGPLLRVRRRRQRARAWRGETQRGGALRGGTLRFPARSRQIKWRIEAKIALVRGSVILTEFLFFRLCFLR
jgi:hypothetical protein